MGGLGNGTNGPEVASGDRLALLWRRLKEHRIAQWTVGYVAVAYGVQHAVTLTSEALDWPHVVTRVSILLLALALPLAMALAWYHGERVSRRVSGPELTIISLLLVGVTILFYAFVRPTTQTVTAASPVTQEASVTAARAAAANPRLGIAVAVMPFANLSGEKDQEYFSDGMTDEISGALAKIPDLSVVARSSAFQFKGKNQDARAIGQQLHATHLIEGSVRKAGDQLRISAELVKAEDGVTVWSNSYDRQLKDVFAVQEDIARAIATSLHMALGLKPGENLVSTRLVDPQAHELYLRALAALRNRGAGVGTAAAETILKQLLARAPNFAPGWALQGLALGLALFNPVNPENLSKDAEAAARKAIALDPNVALAYDALATALTQQGKLAEAVAGIKQAYALDSSDPEILASYRNYLAVLGYLKQALDVSERLSAMEPLIPIYTRQTGNVRMMNGLVDSGISALDAARRELVATTGTAGPRQTLYLAAAYAQLSRFNEAADVLRSSTKLQTGRFRRSLIESAAQILRSGAGGEKISTPLPVFDSELDFAYIYAGVPERMLDRPEKSIRNGTTTLVDDNELWWPMPSSVRKTERFKKLVHDEGLVDLWRKDGWPDLCHPVGAGDFACS